MVNRLRKQLSREDVRSQGGRFAFGSAWSQAAIRTTSSCLRRRLTPLQPPSHVPTNNTSGCVLEKTRLVRFQQLDKVSRPFTQLVLDVVPTAGAFVVTKPQARLALRTSGNSAQTVYRREDLLLGCHGSHERVRLPT